MLLVGTVWILNWALAVPPFDDQRDNQLDELQSGPRQSILANVVAAEPSVKDSDLNSVCGSESN